MINQGNTVQQSLALHNIERNIQNTNMQNDTTTIHQQICHKIK